MTYTKCDRMVVHDYTMRHNEVDTRIKTKILVKNNMADIFDQYNY